jgi:hypothetical protein
MYFAFAMSNAISLNITHSSPKEPRQLKRTSVITKAIAYYEANSQAKSIIKGMAQAKDIKEGKVKAQSFEDAIRDL